MTGDQTDPPYDPITGQPSQANLDTKPLDPSDPNFDPNVNNPTTTWSSGPDSHPTSEYAGWTWDPNMFRYMPSGGTTTPPPTGGTGGGSGTGGTGGGNTGGGNTGGGNTGTTPPPSVAPPAQPSGGPFHPGTGSTEAEWAISQGLPAASSPGTSQPGPAPPAASQVNPGDAAFRQSIRDSLLQALGQGPVSQHDEDIAPAIAANRVATQRGLDSQRAAIAERLNAQGLTGSGALDQQMQAAMERATTSQAQFSGNAVLNQAIARRQELTNLLQMGSSVMSADDARQLQGRIADIDAYLRQQSITNQNQQANDQMGLTGSYYEALLKQQQIRDLLGV